MVHNLPICRRHTCLSCTPVSKNNKVPRVAAGQTCTPLTITQPRCQKMPDSPTLACAHKMWGWPWVRVGDQVLGRRVPSAILASILSCQVTDETKKGKTGQCGVDRKYRRRAVACWSCVSATLTRRRHR